MNCNNRQQYTNGRLSHYYGKAHLCIRPILLVGQECQAVGSLHVMKMFLLARVFVSDVCVTLKSICSTNNKLSRDAKNLI